MFNYIENLLTMVKSYVCLLQPLYSSFRNYNTSSILLMKVILMFIIVIWCFNSLFTSVSDQITILFQILCLFLAGLLKYLAETSATP